jgi:dihydroneopterin aldolase
MGSDLPQPLSSSGSDPLWDATRDYTRVILRDMAVEVRLGIHPWEKHPERPNRLVVNVELFTHQSGDGGFIDYDSVHHAVRAWATRDHVDLLETLVEELAGVCFAISAVEACRVSVLKPDIFNDAAAAGVEIYRIRPR